MSILSPAALAILGNLQSSVKPDAAGKTDAGEGAFLSLLEGGANDFSANTQAEQGLFDTLYSRDDEQEPAAVAQPTANIYADNPQAKPEARKPEETAAPKPEQNTQPKAEQPPAATVQEKNSAPKEAGKKTGTTEDSSLEPTDDVASKLRAKITELSDLLGMLAGLMGLGNLSQVSLRITKVTTTQVSLLSSTQLGMQGMQSFVDLSDRMDQLMAAISASQNLPGSTGQSLSATISAFQSIIFSVTDASGKFDADAFLAKCHSAQIGLADSLQALDLESTPALAQGNIIDIGQLKDGLQKLGQWLGDVQSTATPEAPQALPQPDIETTKFMMPLAAPKVETAASNASATPKKTADEGIASIAPNAAATSAASTAAPVIAANNNQPAGAMAPAAAIQNNSGAGANLSQNNQGGQGGDKAPSAPVSGAAPAASTATGSTAPVTAFGKIMKAASANPAPVAEQVAFNIKTAVKDGASKIQIHLDPGDLGKLHIKIDIASDGTARGIVITADQKSTLDLLQRDARGLEQALADAGIKAESGSLSFNLRGGDQHQQDEARSAFAGYSKPLEEDELAPLAVISRSYVVEHSDGLNIQI